MASFRRALGSSVALLLLVPGAAGAGGFFSARFGGENATPTADQPTAIYFNPAVLAIGRGTRLYVEGLLAWRTASYERPAAAIDNQVADGSSAAGTPDEALAANAGKATLNNVIASPFIGVASDLGIQNLGVGLAFFVPFGGQSSWDKVDTLEGNPSYPGAIDGVQRWSTIEGELRALYLSGAASYYLPGPRLALGASLSFVRQEIDTVRARTAEGTDNLIAGDTIVEGRSRIAVAGNSVAAGLGLMWQAADDLWIGASYQSQPGFGETAQAGTLENKFGVDAVATTEVEVLQSLPDIGRIGAKYQLTSRAELRMSFDYQRWGVFANQCLVDASVAGRNCDLLEDGSTGPDAEAVIVNIPRQWKDTFGVRAGGSYWVSPALELAAGLSFDSEAVPAQHIDPSLVDMNKLIAHGGLRYGGLFDGRLWLNLTLNNVFYFSRDIKPRFREADGSSPGFLAPSRVPDFAGKYSLNVVYANLAAEYRF